jgi:anti-sigma factor RsiW
MACSAADSMIVDRAVGELSPAGRARLRAHLQVCRGCRMRSAQMQRVVALTDYVLRHPGDGAGPGAAFARRRVR